MDFHRWLVLVNVNLDVLLRVPSLRYRSVRMTGVFYIGE